MFVTVKHIISLTGFQVEIVEDVGSSQGNLEIKAIPKGSAQIVGTLMDPNSLPFPRKVTPAKSLTGESLSKIAPLMRISYIYTKSKFTGKEENK